jgi:hypothetical protein
MNPTPWYKSPQYVGMGVALVSAISVLAPHVVVLLGLTDPVVVYAKVEAALTVLGLGFTAGTLIWSMVRRKNSTVQPLTLTQASADAKITQTSQTMQDLHDAIQHGATVVDATIISPSAQTEKPK